MQKIQKMFFASVSSALLLLCVPACGDDGGGDGNVADAGDPDTPDAEEVEPFVCDPVGANAEVGGLLNAPLDSDVEVIVKEPNHPGDPGPENLPQ